MNVLNVLSSKSDNVEAALSADLVRERRARLESEFVQVATYAMIYVGVGMDTITGVGVALAVRAQIFPLLFLVSHIAGTIMLFGPAWWLARRGQVRWALWLMLLVGTGMIFTQMWLVRMPEMILLLPVVFVVPALVLPWQRMLLYLVSIVLVFVGLLWWLSDWHGSVVVWSTALWLCVLFGMAFVVMGAKIQHVWNRFARESVKHERDAAEHARVRLEAEHADQQATARERSRIARDLHDNVKHTLINMRWLAVVGQEVSDSDYEAIPGLLAKIRQQTEQGLDQLQRVVCELRALGSDAPLLQRVEGLADEFHMATVIPTVRGEARVLPVEKEDHLFFIVKEALINAGKYAEATQVNVQIDYRDLACVQLVIQDDGRGACEINPGVGLENIRWRVEQLNGTARFFPNPGSGFRIEVEVPA